MAQPDRGTMPMRCGFVALVGRPNVGKSTLLNCLVGEKLSITSPKAQTTRHVIRAVLTTAQAQFVFVDTPGFQRRHRSALNRGMNRGVTQALQSVDAAILVCEAPRFSTEDREVLGLVPAGVPLLLAINKIDRLRDKALLLPFIDSVRTLREFVAIVPLCAASGAGCDALLRALKPFLPEGAPMFGADELTDRSERFLAAEFLREKLFRRLGDEIPYGLTVDIEKFESEGALRRIHAAVVVDRESHKGIVVGRGGEQLKAVASQARADMERLFGGPVFLEVWVKVRSGWADDERALKSLGYE